MKTILLLLLCVTAIGLSQIRKAPKNPVKKQAMDTALFKGVNKIWIANDMTPNQNLFLLQTALTKRGYRVSINRKLFSVSTADSIVEGGRAAYVLNGRIDSNRIELSGKYNTVAVTSIMGERNHVFKYDITFSGNSKGLPKKMFAHLMEIAEGIQGKKTFIDETKRKRGSLF